jgi:hypothetical protein
VDNNQKGSCQIVEQTVKQQSEPHSGLERCTKNGEQSARDASTPALAICTADCELKEAVTSNILQQQTIDVKSSSEGEAVSHPLAAKTSLDCPTPLSRQLQATCKPPGPITIGLSHRGLALSLPACASDTPDELEIDFDEEQQQLPTAAGLVFMRQPMPRVAGPSQRASVPQIPRAAARDSVMERPSSGVTESLKVVGALPSLQETSCSERSTEVLPVDRQLQHKPEASGASLAGPSRRKNAGIAHTEDAVGQQAEQNAASDLSNSQGAPTVPAPASAIEAAGPDLAFPRAQSNLCPAVALTGALENRQLIRPTHVSAQPLQLGRLDVTSAGAEGQSSMSTGCKANPAQTDKGENEDGSLAAVLADNTTGKGPAPFLESIILYLGTTETCNCKQHFNHKCADNEVDCLCRAPALSCCTIFPAWRSL